MQEAYRRSCPPLKQKRLSGPAAGATEFGLTGSGLSIASLIPGISFALDVVTLTYDIAEADETYEKCAAQ
jgi:hypothetical protein